MTRKGIYLNYITCFLVQSGFFIAIPFAHGTELPTGQSGILYSMRFVIAIHHTTPW